MKYKFLVFFRKYKFYVISSVLLLVWLLVFDRSNLKLQVEMKLKLRELENKKEYYDQELAKVLQEEKEFLGNANSLEKYAREKYFLKKDGETVFVLVDEDNKILLQK